MKDTCPIGGIEEGIKWRSSTGFLVIIGGVLLLMIGSVFEYNNIYSPHLYHIFIIIGGVVLMFGLWIIFVSYGGGFLLSTPLSTQIADAYQKGTTFYEPDNHNLAIAKEYSKVLFENYADEFLYIYSGKISEEFYPQMITSIKKAIDKKSDVRILLEKEPENRKTLAEYKGIGVRFKKFSGEKPMPHFFVSESTYRLELDHCANDFTKGHGIAGITRGFFAFNASNYRTNKLKTCFLNMWRDAEEI